MANEVGTASNLEDLFGKIVSFLTTNAALVPASQQWQVFRQRRDNIAVLTTNLTEPTTGSSGRRSIPAGTTRARSTQTTRTPVSGLTSTPATTPPASHVTWQLRAAREVKTVRLRASLYTWDVQHMLRNFRLQYSDNGSTWTTALTVSLSPTYATGETKDWAVPGTPGSHLYWRILMDSIQGGRTTTVSWMCMMLLQADGTVANHFGSEVILKGVGNSGTEEIFVGIRSEYDAAAGRYNLFMNGYTGYDANEQSWFNQPGALNGPAALYPLAVPMVPCWNTTMPYWFVASGRSFRFAVKVSTSYEGGYLGYILPYATPGQGGLTTGRAAARRLDIAGFPGALDAGDDTDDSANDFRTALPRPSNNARQIGTIPPSTCGNLALEGVEQCDDGDLDNGDGCSSTCAIEPPLPPQIFANGFE